MQAAIRANNYQLAVNPDTGLVTMTGADGTRIGVVSQFDGTSHKVERRLLTVPLKEGGTIADGAIQEDGSIVPTATTNALTTAATALPTPTPSPSPSPTPTPTP